MTTEPNTAPGSEMLTGTAPQTPVIGDTSATGEMPETTTPTSIEDALKEVESLKAALKKANTDAATHRHKAKELDDLKAKAETDKLTETQKLQKQLDDARAELATATKNAQAYKLNSEVRSHAVSLGFADASDALSFLNADQIEYDESGTPTNVDTLLKAILKSKPYLAGKVAPSSGGATNPSRSQSSATGGLTWEVLGKMSRDEYNARRPEIMQWMSTNPIK